MLDLTCQICNAVDHAHAQGVLHRDLRPANVLVSESGMVKVADFGTSRFLEVAGHGHDGDRQPALHGARAVPREGRVRLRHLLARRHDVPDADRADCRTRPRRRPTCSGSCAASSFAPPRTRNSRIPKELNDIVMRAMAPAVGERYQRAGELLDDLLAARSKWAGTRAAGRPSAAAAPPAPGRRRRTPGDPGAAAGPRGAGVAVLLALPQAAALAHRPLPVLWRGAVRVL